ncbi:MAG: diacylglycerol/lipid kinase family protein [Candidatus Nanopelagicales bacterium]
MTMRGLFIANPNATTTSPRAADVITGALAHAIDLVVETTTHRGHAQELARMARSSHYDMVITLGGDGTINETVNGLLHDGPDPDLPILATIPGGSANVLARNLGFPNDLIEATGLVLESLRDGTTHDIGLGRVQFRPEQTGRETVHWFTINAGMGLDAEVIKDMEAQRADGHTASAARYLATVLRTYAKRTDRAHPNLRIVRPGVPDITGVFLAIVQNTAPWTYFGPLPINPCPQAAFDLGLDVFAPQSMSLTATARLGARMVRGSRLGGIKDELALLHDQPGFDLAAEHPMALQVDGDSMGMVSRADFRSVPHALRIAGP